MITSNKAPLRSLYEARRGSLSPEEREKAQVAILDRLISLDAWKNAPLICGYMSMRGEIDLLPIWAAAIDQGKAYALPCTVTDTREGRMIFRRLDSYSPHTLTPARFGIPEPTEAHPILAPENLKGALLLVPGLAFDDGGFRIGYGGGYYDRFLAHLQSNSVPVTTAGLVFATCRATDLPHQAHDIPVDIIIDERRMTLAHGIL